MGKIARVPVMLQMEVCECGAASLGMALAYFGRKLSLEQLRVECGVTSNGSTMTMLKAAAQRNGLTARVYKMDIESVRKVKTPAILHWQMAHFVVLCGFNKRGAVIADPACGRIQVSWEAFSDAFTGIVMTLEKKEELEQQTDEIYGDVVAEGVSFQYGIYDLPVLSEISFTLEKGKSIALVGGSGCGKSTMAKLIAGLYTPSKGKIYYSGQEIDRFSKEYFYEKIAIVDQHISLFSGTVLDNITLFDNRISYEDAVEAARLACIHDEILLRKDGYLSVVEEQVKNFSGGQRQRIEIARALAKKPNILILDEATSALDAAVEEQIMENIRKQHITLIIVAHRLSTIRDCDEIAVMQDGKICERGTHHTLIEQNGVYRTLVEGGNV